MAQFVTAPVSFPVQVTQYGPEEVEDTNSQEGFLLEVLRHRRIDEIPRRFFLKLKCLLKRLNSPEAFMKERVIR